jgi:toxin ParE1/3/4
VAWSLRARRELAAQRRYIAQMQPAAAARLAQRVVAATDRLATYPHLGRAAVWDATGRLRELPVAGTPFLVLYTIDEATATIVIVRVLHGAQRPGLD